MLQSESSWETLVAAHRRVQPLLAAAAGGRSGPQRHEPKAAILACSDARVPPSVIFDQPAGNLFVIRIAGNTAVPAALASLDYAVAKLGIDLIVVLGHTSCGAVTAAAQGTCDGHLAPIVSRICDIAADHAGEDIDRIAVLNVANTVNEVAAHSGPAGRAARQGSVEIRGAIHDLDTGRLMPVATNNPTNPPTPVEAP